MEIKVNILNSPYKIVVKKGLLDEIEQYLDLNRQVLVVSDDKVPSIYYEKVLKKCEKGYLFLIKSGEASKSIDNYEAIMSFLIKNKFTRTDAVIALGGGVVGDLSAFVASTYMRGIAFYNIPTTLLAQVDSSIGGKTAIDHLGIKNVIGSFYQPKMVLVDVKVLETLDERNLYNGLVEVIKMAVTLDEALYTFLYETNDLFGHLEEVITRAILIKKAVVEADPNETNYRRVLNFGHTLGHAFEEYFFGQFYHGECVGLGMLYFCSKDVRKSLITILKKYHLPTHVNFSPDEVIKYLYHDKKAENDNINVVYVEKIGQFVFKRLKIKELYENLKEVFDE